MNSENSNTSDPHRLLLNLSDKIDLKRSDKYVAPSNLSVDYAWENIKSCKNNSSIINSSIISSIIISINSSIISPL